MSFYSYVVLGITSTVQTLDGFSNVLPLRVTCFAVFSAFIGAALREGNVALLFQTSGYFVR